MRILSEKLWCVWFARAIDVGMFFGVFGELRGVRRRFALPHQLSILPWVVSALSVERHTPFRNLPIPAITQVWVLLFG